MRDMNKGPMAFRQMYNFLVDIWQLYREYADTDLTEADIEAFTEKVEHLRKRYQDCRFAVEVLVAIVCEMERVSKIKEETR